MNFILPPPPKSNTKTKLKRVHTISGPPVHRFNQDCINATMNPSSSSVNAILLSSESPSELSPNVNGNMNRKYSFQSSQSIGNIYRLSLTLFINLAFLQN